MIGTHHYSSLCPQLKSHCLGKPQDVSYWWVTFVQGVDHPHQIAEEVECLAQKMGQIESVTILPTVSF